MLGTACAILAASAGGWVIAAGLLALAAILVLANLTRVKAGATDPGLTTEVAILMMFCVGALLVKGPEAVAIAAGAGVAALLQFKAPLHGFAAKLGDRDLKEIMQFALLSLVILPVLPDRTFGPYNVMNPRQIWLMVVLIVGMGLGGYIVHRFIDAKRGEILSGLLGGLISSTATTATYARRSVGTENMTAHAGVVIVIASAIACLRMLAEVEVVAPQFLWSHGAALCTVPVVMAVAAFAFWRSQGSRAGRQTAPHRNPSELKPALIFAALYAVVLLALAAARDYLGSSGAYAVAVLSGLTDMDALTLSTAQLVGAGRLDGDVGWRMIVLGLLSNAGFKTGMVWVIADRSLLRRVAVFNGIVIGAGALQLWLWPRG
jgi:uncharacterized membrane protein (DUF4010 family)